MFIGLNYKRTAPDKTETIVSIDTHEKLEYCKDLKEHGFTFVPFNNEIDQGCAACEA